MPIQAKLKRRKYYGEWYTVPADTKFMAIDPSGDVWCYTTRPTQGMFVDAWMGAQNGAYFRITRTFNWRKSLRPVK